ncbi:MAG: histidine ammonia-lyase [Actinobacteria bacterium]|nr:histidine ammonia-lyase [Actinomycetota bacterium]
MGDIGGTLSFSDVVDVAVRRVPATLSREARQRMEAARRVVEHEASSGRAVYGITTGIGDLANVRIQPQDAERLQRDIVRSHATGVGDPLPTEIVRAMMFLKVRTFSFGHSGVRTAIAERILQMLEAAIHPIVPGQGSLGASGDLAPLAHLALPLMGEGRVEHGGRVIDAAEALRRAGLEPLELSFKEGLALVNGTEMMLALGILTYTEAVELLKTADLAGAMTLEACLGTDRAFDEDIINLRRHPGAAKSASNLRRALAESEIVASHRESDHLVQDAYSLRCMPQVHGAYRDALEYSRTTLERELASAVDNPSVFAERGEVISGGNFHGEALALAADHTTLALAGVATIAERRIARIVDPRLSNGLPAFLTADPGRRSGFMLTQYTAAALVTENRSLSFPSSVDSIPTSAGQEDHVSMGATAAQKARRVLANTRTVLAIEALTASQGLDLRTPLQPAPATAAVRSTVRKVSAFVDEDRSLSSDIEAVADSIFDGSIVAAAEDEIGALD